MRSHGSAVFQHFLNSVLVTGSTIVGAILVSRAGLLFAGPLPL